VLFRHDLSEFWLHHLGEPQSAWVHFDKARYRRWLEEKGPGDESK